METRCELRKHIAFVQQDPYLFPTSLGSSITLGTGDPQIDHSKMQQTIEMTGLSELVGSRHY